MKINKLKMFIKKLFIGEMILLFSLCFGCKNGEVIKYGVEVVETASFDDMKFSFEKNVDTKPKSNIQTKKEKDILFSERIKTLANQRTRSEKKVKGIYVPAYIAGKEDRFAPILQNIINSNINTIVVDVKDEIGRITINMDNEYVKNMKTIEAQIKDVSAFVKLCKENDIYLIARISTFLDNYLTKLRPELAVHITKGSKAGKRYRDNSGYYWLDPYNEEVQKYLLEIGKGCAKAGFDEVQYDYFRFSADAGMRNVVFPDEETKGRSKIDMISELSQMLYEELIKENIFISIDVFGAIMNSYKDQNSIGQEYQTLLKNVDYLCPMVYPSHYANKTFDLDVPDTKPYEAVKSALNTSTTVIAKTFDPNSHYGGVRPWLQGFTANYLAEYITYGVNEYKEQIKAVEDAGYDEWLFWHPGGAYKWEAFQ